MQFTPNWTSSAKDSIINYAKLNKLSITDVQEKCNIDLDESNFVISSEQADLLSSLLGGSPKFWVDRAQYAAILEARNTNKISLDEKIWIKDFPYSYIKTRNNNFSESRNEATRLNNLLQYFDCSDIVEFNHKHAGLLNAIAFRKSYAHETNYASTLTWIQEGIKQSRSNKNVLFDPEAVELQVGKFRELVTLNSPSDFVPRIKSLALDIGIKLSIVPTPPKCTASGAVFVFDGVPHIILSFRYRNDAQFWFTLFHELGHCRLHTGRSLFLEGTDDPFCDEEEEADQFAVASLYGGISNDELEAAASKTKWMHKVLAIKRIAKRERLSPGLIVGRMQHLGLVEHRHLNKLKIFYDWAEIPNL